METKNKGAFGELKMDGTVKFFNEKKGFGFITQEEGTDDLFFHISDVQNQEELTEGDAITFEVGDGDRGKKATKIFKK